MNEKKRKKFKEELTGMSGRFNEHSVLDEEICINDLITSLERARDEREATHVSFEDYNIWEDGFLETTWYRERDETDEEFTKRLEKEEFEKFKTEKEERSTLAKLKEKYEK